MTAILAAILYGAGWLLTRNRLFRKDVARLGIWIVFAGAGFSFGRIALPDESWLLPGFTIPGFFLFFSIGILLTQRVGAPPHCRHRSFDVLARLGKTFRLPILVVTYEEIALTATLGFVAGALTSVWPSNFQASLLPRWLVYLLGGALLGGISMQVWLGDRGCIHCNEHHVRDTPYWYKPLTDPNHPLVTTRCRIQAGARADELVSWMRAPENEGGIVVLNGDKGAGKSTFKNLILHFVWRKYRQKVLSIEIAPWETLGPAGLQRRILLEILEGLGRHFSLGNYHRDWRGLLDALSKENPLAPSLRFLTSDPSASHYLDEMRNLFLSLPQEVLVVLEDLERLERAELIAILRLIDALRQFPKLHFFIPTSVADCDRILSGRNPRDKEFGPQLLDRTLIGLKWDVYLPEPNERVELIKNRLLSSIAEWAIRIEAEGARNPAYPESISRAHSRWERALARVSLELQTFRRLNLFSQQFLRDWMLLKADVDLPDLAIVILMRIVDPICYERLFSIEAPLYGELAVTHDGGLIGSSLMFRQSKDTLRLRIQDAQSIYERSLNRPLTAFVLTEIFGVSFIETESSPRISDIASPHDWDKLTGRLRHPAVLREYVSKIPGEVSELKKFIDAYKTTPAEMAVPAFMARFFELLELFRQTGSRASLNFLSDLPKGFGYVFREDVPKTKGLILALVRASVDLRPIVDPFQSELKPLAGFIWVLLYFLPKEQRHDVLLQAVAECPTPLLLGDFYHPSVNKEHWFSRLRSMTDQRLDQEMFDQIVSWEEELTTAAVNRFSGMLHARIGFDEFDLDRNNSWIYQWYVDISPDKTRARNENLKFILDAYDKDDKVVLKAFIRYWRQPFFNTGELHAAMVNAFGEAGAEELRNRFPLLK